MSFATGQCVSSLLSNRIAEYWVKSQVYFEEPDIKFEGDLTVNMLDMNGQSATYSTNLEVNNLQG